MKASELLELLAQENIEIKDLPELLVNALIKKKKRIATAESCTGGLVSGAITSVSGASGVFDCGVCSYANHIKHKIVGVREETLSTYGAVSDRTAAEMARGIRLLANADIGISTTGIAGPLGGSQYKPVGLVYIGVSTELGLHTEKMLLGENNADRERIRELAVAAALYFALKETEKMSKAQVW
ncbi:MAG: CinA family protein [Ruminococcus sp.]|uniref:CinA family protein n=1 Tax=Ruminococcus sp. TaxID=41978 RepID=UPI002872B71F|nr:CinA family protein [Ruminococcus sp.]MBQ3284390.1 CinA family protein [Ruminococcus sp.]